MRAGRTPPAVGVVPSTRRAITAAPATRPVVRTASNPVRGVSA
jgi:hypothetical protein